MAPFSEELFTQIREAVERGERSRDIAARLHVPYYRVRTLSGQWKRTGEMHQEPAKPQGRPAKLRSQEEEACLRGFLERFPDALIKDVTDYLALQCGIDVDNSTVYRAMSRLGLLIKRPKTRERDTLGMWKATLPRDEHGNAWYGPTKDIGRVKRKRDPKGPARKEAMMNEKMFSRVDIFVKNTMSHPRFDGSHDYAHVQRVVNLAKHILKVERRANPSTKYETMVVELGALMHEIGDRKYNVDGEAAQAIASPVQYHHAQSINPSAGHFHSPPDAPSTTLFTPSRPPDPAQTSLHEQDSSDSDQDSDLAENPAHPSPPPAAAEEGSPTSDEPLQKAIESRLHRLRVPKRLIPAICSVCFNISYTSETTQPDRVTAALATHPELAIVQDADRLDSLGAIGIGRTFTYGAAKAPERGMQGTMTHVDEKLLRLEGMMKTGEGRRMARVRTERVQSFRQWWDEEMRMGMGIMEEEAEEEDAGQGQVRPSGGLAALSGRTPWLANGFAGVFDTPTNGPHGAPAGPFTASNSGGSGTGVQQRSHGRMNQRPSADNPNMQLMMEAGMLR